jgi:sterol desaturase/sphingolipid hydroxylase (fatty acid hydroxylase superfamily)
MLERLQNLSLIEASGFFLVANVVIFIGSVTLCWWLGCLFKGRKIFQHNEPFRMVDLTAAVGATFFNALIGVLGWWLWINGFIHLKSGGFLAGLFDCALMLMFMDFSMYITHRLVHHPWLFPLFHRFHHRHENTNPISLFVLHPVEVVGFGFLMILFLLVYPITFWGLVTYLTVNVLWGTLGHSGVEPFPKQSRFIPGIQLLGTSTFHAEHHERQKYNFGFYTLIWDKLFRTLDPEYDRLLQKED